MRRRGYFLRKFVSHLEFSEKYNAAKKRTNNSDKDSGILKVDK